MSATIDDIRKAIVVVDGKVVVNPATLASNAVTAMLGAYFADQTMTIEGAAIVSGPNDDFVTVTGSIKLFDVNVTGQAQFYADGEAQIDFRGAAPAGWHFGDSFASLAQTYFNDFALASPAFRLLSKSREAIPGGASLDAGFALPAILEPLRWFANPVTSARISGPITLTAGQPVMTLAVSPAIDAQIGGYLGVKLQMEHLTIASPRPRDPSSAVVSTMSRLAGDITLGDPPKLVHVPLAAYFNEDLTVLKIRLDTAEAVSLGLSQIAHWFNGFDVVQALPQNVDTNVGLTLHDVVFAIGLRTKALEYVSLAVTSTQPWVVLAHAIEIKSLAIDLMVLGLPSAPALEAAIRGVLEVGGPTLDIYAQVPNFLIKGSLSEGSSIDLSPLLAHLGAPQEGLPNDLKIDELSLEADPGGSRYDFAVAIDGHWTIIKGLVLEELAMTVNYRGKETGKGALSASVKALLEVGGVGISVSATRDGEDESWSFFGGLSPDSELRLGELLENLTAQFSSTAAQALPEALTSLVITRLAVTFDTLSKDFTFDCTLDFKIGSTNLDLRLRVALQSNGDGYTQQYSGSVRIGAVRLALLFEKIKPAMGDKPAQPATFFVAAVEPALKLRLRDLVATVDAEAGALVPDLAISLEELLFVYENQAAITNYLFGAALDFDIELSTLPLVGKVFAGEPSTGLKDVQLLFTRKQVSLASVSGYNKLLGEIEIKPLLPTGPAAAPDKPLPPTTIVLDAGFNLSANLSLGGQPTPISAGGASAPVTSGTAPPHVAPKLPAGNATWVDINKAIGPVTVQRVGVRYEDGYIWLLLDAGLQLAVLQFGLQGLGLGFNPQDPASIRAELAGMSLAYESGPLKIAGGFLNYAGDYLGAALVKAGQFSFSAIGGLAVKDQSFFIFVRLNAPLGGPPFFFITGLAGGFGVNRSLQLPKIDALTTFPLLPQNNSFPTRLDAGNPGGTLAETLAAAESYIHPEAGEYWIAAGIDFTSFEMIDASALLTVAFGVRLEIALLGICRITIPKGDPEPIVFLEVALEARFDPAEGILAVDGRITPSSFILDGLVRISGGFAFYLWYSGEHAGDFVVTIGGYHPHFQRPEHYPIVPRLELSYGVGPLTMKGDAYVALVPHMLMGGIDVRITWETGPVKAWLDAGLDFLLAWRPFHYEARAHVDVGASLHLKLLFVSINLTVHVGAEFAIWGSPFGGKATVDLEIFSFTIHFGDSPRKDLVTWDSFKQSFLPATTSSSKSAHARLAAAAPTSSDARLCTAAVSDGLSKQPQDEDPNAFFSWIVDANHFEIVSNTLIPAKTGRFNDFKLNNPFHVNQAFTYDGAGTPATIPDAGADAEGLAWPKDFGVLPVGIGSDFESGHAVALRKLLAGADYADQSKYTDFIDGVRVSPVLANSQQALWASSNPGLNGERLIADTLVGLSLSPMIQRPEITLRADLWSMMFDQNQTVSWRVSAPDVPASDSFDAHIEGESISFNRGGKVVTLSNFELGEAMTASAVASSRAALVSSLQSLGLPVDPSKVDVAHLADYPLWDWPVVESLGEERSAS